MSRARMREVSRPPSAAAPRVSMRSATRSQGLRPLTDSVREACVVSCSARFEAMRRIQAHFRGNRVRRKLVHCSNQSPEASQPGRLVLSSHTFGGRSSRSGSIEGPSAEDLKSPKDVRKLICGYSFATTADYERLFSALQARPSRWSARLQRCRISAYLLLEEPRSSNCAQVLSMVILVCILVSISAAMLETMPELQGSVGQEVWFVLEVTCTVVFTCEYVARLLVCNVPGTTVCKFICTPMNIVDLFAILPFYLWLGMQHIEITKALGVLRTVRLVRLFRIFKLGRYSVGLQLMILAMRNSSHALWVLSFFLGIGVVLFSSAIYYVEKMGCPDRIDLVAIPMNDGTNRTQLDHYIEECRSRPGRTNDYGICCNEHDSPLDFPTIIEAFWWSIVTMTTVGFGDVRPRTGLGRVVGTATMLSGILLIALPIAIIGRKFQEAYAQLMEQQNPAQSKATTRTSQEAGRGNLSMAEMGRRLKLMRLHDADLAKLARELAEQLEELGAVQKEVVSMQAFERARQLQAVEHFSSVVEQLAEISKPSKSAQAMFVTGAFRGSAKKKSPVRTSSRKGSPVRSSSKNGSQPGATRATTVGVPTETAAPVRRSSARKNSAPPLCQSVAAPPQLASSPASSSNAPWPPYPPRQQIIENVGG